MWALIRDYADGPNPLNDAVLSLLSESDDLDQQVNALHEEFEIRVRCWGASDSERGGFWLSSEVTRRLAQLGMEVHCTVYIEAREIRRELASSGGRVIQST